MKKAGILLVLVAAAVAGVMYYRGRAGDSTPAAADGPAGGAPGQGAGGAGAAQGRGRRGGGPGGQFGRPPMTVETAVVTRASISGEITVVGSLVGDATVSVSPRAAGRLQEVSVRLGDRVTRGQRLARIEDFEIQEQVKQAEAAQQVSEATIRQREADLRLAETNAERSRNLFERQLLPKQTLDDNEARYQSAMASVDLARAQSAQSKARLDELRINLANTIITSPVNGFVSRRAADPGAFVSQNVPVVDVVDISKVRLEASVVEKDLKELQAGDETRVQVDAYPGETFSGRIARVSPVLDPATRTAPIEVEIPNAGFRLKPGMYARVRVTTDTKKDALVVPTNAVIDLGGRRGVFMPLNESAVFRAIEVGAEQKDVIEVRGGLAEGDTVITTGAGALRDGDRIVLPGARGGRGDFGAPGNNTTAAPRGGRATRGGDPSLAAAPGDGQAPSGARRAGGGREGASPDGARRFGGDGSTDAAAASAAAGEGRRGRRGTSNQAPPS